MFIIIINYSTGDITINNCSGFADGRNLMCKSMLDFNKLTAAIQKGCKKLNVS